MSKYIKLWEYVQQRNEAELCLTFDEIAEILCFPVDHALLNCKQELEDYGYQVGKISMKKQAVIFNRTDTQRSDSEPNGLLEFADREAFRQWLTENCRSQQGVWLRFGKAGGLRTVSAAEALEEALCFGWIDGQMQSLNDRTYKKYFTPRRRGSQWSVKNKTLAMELEKQGRMTEAGREKIEEAKANGHWDAPKPAEIGADQIEAVAALLKGIEPAFTHFQAMSLSVRKTYAKAYFAAKTEAGRTKRREWMIDRLNRNLKPM